jgi:hypothetical protein
VCHDVSSLTGPQLCTRIARSLTFLHCQCAAKRSLAGTPTAARRLYLLCLSLLPTERPSEDGRRPGTSSSPGTPLRSRLTDLRSRMSLEGSVTTGQVYQARSQLRSSTSGQINMALVSPAAAASSTGAEGDRPSPSLPASRITTTASGKSSSRGRGRYWGPGLHCRHQPSMTGDRLCNNHLNIRRVLQAGLVKAQGRL